MGLFIQPKDLECHCHLRLIECSSTQKPAMASLGRVTLGKMESGQEKLKLRDQVRYFSHCCHKTRE